MAVEVEVDGLAEMLADFEDAAEQLKDLSGPLAVAAESLKGLIDKSFHNSTAADGRAWDTLKPATKKAKARDGYSPKPLIRNGARGLQGQTFVRSNKTTITMGTNIPYGAVHLYGSKDGTTPARPYMPVKMARGGWREMFRKRPELINSPEVDQIMADLEDDIIKDLFPDG